MTYSHTASPYLDALSPSPASLDGRRPLPRVAIAAFLESDSTYTAMEQASADRRLARADIAIHEGGILAAANRFAKEANSDVVIVESDADADLLLVQIDALAEVCELGTRVIVIGRENDAQLFRALRARGVDDYLLAPVSPVTLLDALTQLYDRKADDDEGNVIAFMGTRGGVGASTLAHHVAWSLAHQHGEETLLLDLDLAFGTAALDFNCQPLQSINEALLAAERLDVQLLHRLKTPCGERLSMLAAPESLDVQDIRAEAIDPLLQCARQDAAYIVADLSPGWNAMSDLIMLNADRNVLVMTPDLASLRNAKALREMIARRRPHDTPPVLVLNQSNMPDREDIPLGKIRDLLGVDPDITLPFAPGIFTRAANRGQTLFEANPKSSLASTLEQFSAHLAGVEAETKKRKSKKSFLGLPRFLRKKGG